MIRPEIIIKAYNAQHTALKEICSGIEEEGVLYRVITEQTDESERLLGSMASYMSQLEVGIGIRAQSVALYIKKIKHQPLFTTTTQYRSLGQNAARYVKGNPLIDI